MHRLTEERVLRSVVREARWTLLMMKPVENVDGEERYM